VLEAVKANTEADPKQVLADARYRSEEEMARVPVAEFANNGGRCRQLEGITQWQIALEDEPTDPNRP
jgi:hypothetical protein